jgi:subtilase family serine protease
MSQRYLMSNIFRAKSFLVCWWCCCAFTFGVTSALAAQSVRTAPQAVVLISQPIDSSRLHTLAGNTRSEANSQNDRGKVADTLAMDHMLMQLQRSPEREQVLRNFIEQQNDSTSPNFHKWLTATEFGQMYGPAPQDIETVSEWLRSSGFTVNTVYPSGMSIDFSGTAGEVSAAFHTEIHRLSVSGKDHIANMSDPQIPEALAPVVAGIVSLHDFRPHAMVRPRAKYTAAQDGSTFQILAPADLATIYDLNRAFSAGYTGQGQTIAVVEDSNLYRAADWNTFRSVLGLSGYTSGSLSTTHPAPPSGTSNCSDPGVTSDDIEATPDAEWASAAAPNAQIEVASCSNGTTTFGGLIAAQNLINGSGPPQIISVSYGECEAANGAALNAAYNSTYQQGVAEGVSVFVAAGDEGAASCDSGFSSATRGIGVSAYASTAYDVAVGGTDFADTSLGTTDTYWSSSNSSAYGSALSYIPEIPWNDSCASSILAVFSGYSVGYGPNGFCGSIMAQQDFFVEVEAGSGGPSGCATGAPAANQVVGGSCQGYAKPAWQTGVSGIPQDGVRDIPDVSLFAGTGVWNHYYVTCFSDPSNDGAPCTGAPVNWGGAGGTSFASPIMAGIQALVNQKMGAAQGNPNPVYYKLAASSVASSVFHTITTGDIAVDCAGEINCFGIGFEGRGRATPTTEFVGNGALSTSSQTYTPAFAAGSGWNFATGLGSVDGYNLILNWSKGQ